MFDCGISMTVKEIQRQFDDECVKVVQEYGFNIDKDRLQKAITDSRSFYDEGYRDAKRIFERRPGKWICTVKSSFPQYEPDEYRCSICNGIGYKLDKFCKHCGADMEAYNDY